MDRPHRARHSAPVSVGATGQAFILTGLAAGHDSAVDLQTRHLVNEVEAAGMAVRVVRTVEEASALFDKPQARESPTVLIFGPAVEHPITLARRLHYQVPQLHAIFAVGAEREQKLRRDLTYAAPLGSRWTVAPADSKALSSVIPRVLKALSQQQRLRTTLDRINVTLAAPAPPTSAITAGSLCPTAISPVS